jgi:hypothetical protein
MITLNEIRHNPATSTFLSVVGLGSFTEHAREYRINSQIYTPIAGESGISLHRKGKLTIAKLKSSRLSYNVVVRLLFELILSKISRYEANMSGYFEFIGIYQTDIIMKIIIVDG